MLTFVDAIIKLFTFFLVKLPLMAFMMIILVTVLASIAMDVA